MAASNSNESALTVEERAVVGSYRELSRWEKNCLFVLLKSMSEGDLNPESTDDLSWDQLRATMQLPLPAAGEQPAKSVDQAAAPAAADANEWTSSLDMRCSLALQASYQLELLSLSLEGISHRSNDMTNNEGESAAVLAIALRFKGLSRCVMSLMDENDSHRPLDNIRETIGRGARAAS